MHKNSWIKRDQLDVTGFIISLFNAQRVSDVNTSIFRSLRLMCWVISWVVLLSFDVCWCYGVVWPNHNVEFSNMYCLTFSFNIFLTKLRSETDISWHVSYSHVDGRMLEQWNIQMCMCVYVYVHPSNTTSLEHFERCHATNPFTSPAGSSYSLSSLVQLMTKKQRTGCGRKGELTNQNY